MIHVCGDACKIPSRCAVTKCVMRQKRKKKKEKEKKVSADPTVNPAAGVETKTSS